MPLLIAWRDALREEDPAAVGDIVRSTGVFRPDEAEVAVELAQTALRDGAAPGYHFLFAHPEGDGPGRPPAGYACYGPIPCTVRRFDLYWIAVAKGHQGQGLGQAILAEALRRMARLGARRCYAETSGTAPYAPTRRFYEKGGGKEAARVPGYYGDGDDLVMYAWEMDTGAKEKWTMENGGSTANSTS